MQCSAFGTDQRCLSSPPILPTSLRGIRLEELAETLCGHKLKLQCFEELWREAENQRNDTVDDYAPQRNKQAPDTPVEG